MFLILRDWINIDYLNNKNLSTNKNSIELLKTHYNKIDWDILSSNINAIELLKNNLDKVNWNILSMNYNAIEILKTNVDKINWEVLYRNTNVIKLLKYSIDEHSNIHNNTCWLCSSKKLNIKFFEKNINKLMWNILLYYPDAFNLITNNINNKDCKFLENFIYFANIIKSQKIKYNWEYINIPNNNIPNNNIPNNIQFLETNKNKLNWNKLSSNKYSINFLEKNIEKINWNNLSNNENAIKLLRNNINKINWKNLLINSNSIELLEENINEVKYIINKINSKSIWWKLFLSKSINIRILKNNIILKYCDWKFISKNPYIFTYDYKKIKEVNKLKNESASYIYNPKFVNEFLQKYSIINLDNKELYLNWFNSRIY